MSTTTLDERAQITWDKETAHDLAEHLAETRGRKAQVDLLEEGYGFPRSWSHRHLTTLLMLTDEQMTRFLNHADPTGESAVRAVLSERGY